MLFTEESNRRGGADLIYWDVNGPRPLQPPASIARAASKASHGACLAARALSIIILEVFNVSVIQIYKINHCSLA